MCSHAPTCRPRTRGFSASHSSARHLDRARPGTFLRRTSCGPCKLRSGRGPDTCSGRARNPSSVLSLRNACTSSVRSPPPLRTVCIFLLWRTRSRRKVSLGCSFGMFFWYRWVPLKIAYLAHQFSYIVVVPRSFHGVANVAFAILMDALTASPRSRVVLVVIVFVCVLFFPASYASLHPRPAKLAEPLLNH
jgi:hypothetical protein